MGKGSAAEKSEKVHPEVEKLMARKGRIYLGSKPISSDTATKLNKLMDDIHSGKKKCSGFPPAWVAKEKSIKDK